ncbi:TPR repeat protein [Parvularcula bermudensis HTCC2503]|uniref:TPR repeat protein n=1 Tax=Parvularcula bermudensis (strain ATCC BAA-594 / HTCC2503 / KCTC 12087) TaxID=314260 RepID=E0TDU7_PARBH|nr:tetratricopeptide repeat protein [Parvularcula bermudensis]ADM10013.1 TPR repeat protein [Parvularcula bermudensis HTCC2503]
MSLSAFRFLTLITLGAMAACAGGPGLSLSSVADGYRNPQTVAGDYLQGKFAASQHDYNFAAAAFDRANQESGARALKAGAFRSALAAGEFDRAITYAHALLALEEREDTPAELESLLGFLDRDLPRLTLAAQAFRRDDISGADTVLERPFESSLGQGIADLLSAWVIYDAEGSEAAIASLRSTQNPAIAAFAPLHLGLMFDLDGASETAEVAYAEALRGDAQDLALEAYGGLLERRKPREEAISFYSKLAEDQGFARRLGRLGLARLEAPLPQETAEFVRIAERTRLRIVQNPSEGAALVFLNFAWAAYEQAIARQSAARQAGFGDLPINLDVPLSLARLAVAIDPDLDAAHYVLGAIKGFYDRPQEAAEALDRIAPSSWLYNYATIDQADAYLALDRADQAIALLERYLTHDALAPDVALTLSQIYADEGRTDKAVFTANRALSIASDLSSEENREANLWRYYFSRGAILTEADRWTEAEPDLREALVLAPEEPVVLNYLGYSYVERGQRLDEALAMIERALDQRPASGAITDSLGWAHYQLGNYQEAVRYLEQAVELEPGDDVITDHLGDAYWQVGRQVEARFEWRRVLQIDGLSAALRQSVEAKLAGTPPAPGTLADQAVSSGDASMSGP